MNHHDIALWREVIALAVHEVFGTFIDHPDGIAFMYMGSKRMCDIGCPQQFEIVECRVTPKCYLLMHVRCVHILTYDIYPTPVAPHQLLSRPAPLEMTCD